MDATHGTYVMGPPGPISPMSPIGPIRSLPLVSLSAPDLNRDHDFPKVRPALQVPERVGRLPKWNNAIDHRLEPVL